MAAESASYNRMKSNMAAESASYSMEIDVWRRQERDDGSVIENDRFYAQITNFNGFCRKYGCFTGNDGFGVEEGRILPKMPGF